MLKLQAENILTMHAYELLLDFNISAQIDICDDEEDGFVEADDDCADAAHFD